MSKHINGFMDFIREQGVVGLAVGLAIGAAAGDAVKSIVDNLINPLVGLILGGTDLSSIETTVMRGGKELVFGWGNILNGIITLLAVAATVYLIVHMLKMDRLDKKKKD
ncbi:large conductance mechanosensitive channel protein MscL [Candidatus Saccharibacteria bacterium]|nr:MAG: large conductance mechanosensitive channel protein MscL [Candidatus Saccharibacteria bacterium]